VSINVSAESLREPRFIINAERLLTERLPDPSLLNLEITDGALLSDPVWVAGIVERLASHGCRFALGGFGRASDALPYIRHLPLTYVKIDKHVVRDAPHDTASRALISAIAGMAAGWGQTTVAEGVGDQLSLDMVEQLGVDLAQGDFVGRPGPL
jgi:EAL domain-containing protein (putative c-di-GMP-specific phosphodiesterase class I)